MHEMAIAHSILDLVEHEAARQHATRVRTLELEIGQLANVDVGALRFALDVVLRDTIAHGARLEIAEPPGQAFCLRCGDEVALARRGEPCAACGSYQLAVTGGDTLRVAGMIVD
ncbi:MULTISPECIES: hydrogenase maturation nickel metallochaperone HypA [Paraburkholderia]|jgi:hydrogenase nickel incorporation protein HypA/HybF|uniref:Hydrogenase maturation factor HypA n=1 Tax=Paraburkholderia tropica TaxID=92647 RepID=A0AAQ1GAI7_9BURK|nr:MULTISPECIES: hydrogenase maturation nickel metallochaperone HypA [Paraburkholderia]MBN3814651.1 hydrogenase maturation nickel metallochaperone HypA [Paraburkholderia sp. Ac-20347]RQN40195.1 hydrogenase maturation nickel metallochaperone HypA [Paraburkholderia tropica]SEI80686.1 hydrogenase nickel incorporation protein HypA/HybF [Paraburkholderia tropica]